MADWIAFWETGTGQYVWKCLGCFIAIFSYASLNGLRGKMVVYTSFFGMLSELSYMLCRAFGLSLFLSALIASIEVALMAQIGARLFKTPSTAILLPAFYPLVPGYYLYRTVLNFINGKPQAAGKDAETAILISAAVALGIMFVEGIFIFLSSKKRKKEKGEKNAISL